MVGGLRYEGEYSVLVACVLGLILSDVSLHSGKTNGLVPKIWPEHNCTGFDVLQHSFIDFTHHCFSKDDIFWRER
jgi:hypothetical protein